MFNRRPQAEIASDTDTLSASISQSGARDAPGRFLFVAAGFSVWTARSRDLYVPELHYHPPQRH